MAKMLFCMTYGFDNPNRATLPLYLAEGAVEAGHEVTLVFMNDAASLLQEDVASKLNAHGFPTFIDMLENFEGDILLCTGCANSRGIFEDDINIRFNHDPEGNKVEWVSRTIIANAIADADKVITI